MMIMEDKIAVTISIVSAITLLACWITVLGTIIMNAHDKRKAARYWIRECINGRGGLTIPMHVMDHLRGASNDKRREYVVGCMNNVRKLYEPHEPTLPQILDIMTSHQRKLIMLCIGWPDMFGNNIGFHDAVLLYLMEATDPEPLTVERWARRIQSQMAGSARAARS